MTYGLTPDERPKAQVVADSPRIADDVACANCGGSLRGVTYVGACPTCGVAVAQMDRIRAERHRHDPCCPSCGYNLRGLPAGGKCPECGLPMAPETRGDTPLCIMPTQLIGRFWIGSWLATACIIIAASTSLWMRFSSVGGQYIAAILILNSLAFVVAVWILTPALNSREAIAHGFYQRSVLRKLTRWLALGWPIAATIGMLTLFFAGNAWYPALAADRVLALGVVAGLANVVCLALVLENLSNWTCDDWAGKCLNFTAFGLPTSWLLLQFPWPLPFITILIGLLWMASLIALVLGLLSLSGSVAMSVFHHHEYEQRLGRRQERQQQHDRKMARRFERMDTAQASRKTGARSA